MIKARPLKTPVRLPVAIFGAKQQKEFSLFPFEQKTIYKYLSFILPFLFINIAFFSFSQNEYHVETRSRDTVKTVDSTLLKKNRTIVLLETDSFIVSTKYSAFIKHYKKWIKEYPDIDGDSILLQKILQDTTKNIVRANEIAKTPILSQRLIFRASELMEKGNCLIYNKSIRKVEKFIIIEHWWTLTSKGRPAGNMGRIFKTVKNSIILKIYDGAI